MLQHQTSQHLVLLALLLVTIDDDYIINHLSDVINNGELVYKMASRSNLSGADQLFINCFNTLFQQGNYLEAAKVAASAPKGILRTRQASQRFIKYQQCQVKNRL